MTVQSHSRRSRLPWAHLQHVYCWHQSLTHSSVQRTAVPQQSIARAGHETEYYTEHARELGVGRGCEHERSLRASRLPRARARAMQQDPDKLCSVECISKSIPLYRNAYLSCTPGTRTRTRSTHNSRGYSHGSVTPGSISGHACPLLLK